jgi:hypothetical protein
MGYSSSRRLVKIGATRHTGLVARVIVCQSRKETDWSA